MEQTAVPSLVQFWHRDLNNRLQYQKTNAIPVLTVLDVSEKTRETPESILEVSVAPETTSVFKLLQFSVFWVP